MKKRTKLLVVAIVISLIIHSSLLFLFFEILKPERPKPPAFPKQTIVDIVTLPKPKTKHLNEKKKEEHKIASNVARQGKARVYSKEEKVPFGEKKPIASIKHKRIERIKPQIKKRPLIAHGVNKNKVSSSNIRPQKQPKVVRLKGGLFNSLAMKEGFRGGTSKEYEYKKTTKKEATINIGTQSIKYASYLEHIKDKVQDVWIYPEEAIKTGQQGGLLVLFSIGKDGNLVRVKLIKSSGYPLLDQAALQALKDASPFPPLPKRFGVDILNIYATFEYSLGYYFIE